MKNFKRIAIISGLLLVVILGSGRVVNAFSTGFGMNSYHMGSGYKDSDENRQVPSETWEQHINDMVEDGAISEEQANDRYNHMKHHHHSCHSYSSTNDTNKESSSSNSRQQMHGRGMMGERK